jgi:hypothetical protein
MNYNFKILKKGNDKVNTCLTWNVSLKVGLSKHIKELIILLQVMSEI